MSRPRLSVKIVPLRVIAGLASLVLVVVMPTAWGQTNGVGFKFGFGAAAARP